jgi:ABC-type amino acid transport substrate-binding protein
MKKLLALLLLGAFQAFAAAALAENAPDTLGRIKSAKAINVAYSPDSIPFSFDDKGAPAGYSIDICKRVIAQIGRKVGDPNLKVNWIPASTPDRLKLVASGKADLECANTSQTLSRLANVDFSALIYLEMGGLVARADANVMQLGDLGGKKVVVLKGTTTETALRKALQAKLINAEVVTVDKAADGVKALELGSADAYAGDRIKLLGLLSQAQDPKKFTFLPDRISYEPYALALPRNDSALRLEVNRALSQLYSSGEIVNIYGAWLGSLGAPPDLITAMYIISAIPD